MGIQGLLSFTLQHGRKFIALKNVKKYFHEAPKVVKVMRINKQCEINIKVN